MSVIREVEIRGLHLHTPIIEILRLLTEYSFMTEVTVYKNITDRLNYLHNSLTLTEDAFGLIFPQLTASSGDAPESDPSNSLIEYYIFRKINNHPVICSPISVVFLHFLP